jgi:hypothetical protein
LLSIIIFDRGTTNIRIPYRYLKSSASNSTTPQCAREDGNDDNFYDCGELVMGKKFAEGGHAELYEAHVKWWYPEGNEEDLRDGREYVLKVFKKGTFLKHLKSQLPQGLLKVHIEDMEIIEFKYKNTW